MDCATPHARSQVAPDLPDPAPFLRSAELSSRFRHPRPTGPETGRAFVRAVRVLFAVGVSAATWVVAAPQADRASRPEASPGSASPRAASAHVAGSRLAEGWRWRVFGERDGFGAATPSALWIDADDTAYVVAADRLLRYGGFRFDAIPFARPPRAPIERIVRVQGELYCASRSELFRLEGGSRWELAFPTPGTEGTLLLASGDLETGFLIFSPTDGSAEHHQVHGRRVERFDADVRVPRGEVTDYRVDGAGTHWLVTGAGRLHFRRALENRWNEVRRWEFVGELSDAICRRLLVFEKPARSGLLDPELARSRRVLWGVFHPAADPERWMLARHESGTWRVLGRQIREGSRASVESIVQDHEHNHYATCEDGSLFFLPNGGEEWLPVRSPEGRPRQLFGGLVDSQGGLWFRTRGGIALCDLASRRWRRLPTIAGMEHPEVRALLEDSEGRLWVATTDGLVSYVPEPPDGWRLSDVRTHGTGARLAAISGLAEDSQGNIWVSSAEAFTGAFLFDGRVWERPPAPEGFRDRPIRRIVADRLQELWFLPEDSSSSARAAVFRRSALTGWSIEPVPISGYTGRAIFNDLVRAAGDVLWIASQGGLLECSLESDRLVVTRAFGEAEGVGPKPWALAQGPDKAIWVSYWGSGSGVTRIDGEDVRTFGVEDGLGNGHVLSIVADGFDLWFGTQEGLTRFDGDCWYRLHVAAQASASSWVYSLLPFGAGTRRRGVLVGTLGDGVWQLELDDRESPAFTVARVPERVASGETVTVSWEAKDFRRRSLDEEIQYRHRIDGGRWSPFSSTPEVSLVGLADGVHEIEVEARDLDGNSSRRYLARSIRVGSEGPHWAAYAALGALGLGAALALGWLLRSRLRARREEIRRYRGVFRGFPSAVIVVDREDRVRAYNGVSAEALGLDDASRAELLGRPLRWLPALVGLDLVDALRRARAGEIVCLEKRSRAEGSASSRVLEIRLFSHLAGANGSRPHEVVVVASDRTRDEELATATARLRRLESTRRLGRRLAEELDAIRAWVAQSRAVAQNAPATADARADAEAQNASEALRRVERVLRTLRALETPAAELASDAERDVSVDEVIESVLESGRGPASTTSELDEGPWRVPPGVRIDHRAHLGLWPARIEREVLARVLREVFRNAFAALEGRGDVSVRTDNVRVESRATLAAGSYVEMVIRDEGSGLDAAQLERIFDPFWSTRPRDEALGLGLTVAHALLCDRGGDLVVESEPGHGTTVRIWIPARR